MLLGSARLADNRRLGRDGPMLWKHDVEVDRERWTITLKLPVHFTPAQVQRTTKDQRDALRLEVGYDARSRVTRVTQLIFN